MRIVLDTNVVLISLPIKSPYRKIFDDFKKEKFTLVVSTEILLEYEEILGLQINPSIAKNVIRLITSQPNIEFQETYFRWNLIRTDPDDNKFVDCALASNANYIVTDDRHFSILKNVDFPSIEIVNADQFLNLLS